MKRPNLFLVRPFACWSGSGHSFDNGDSCLIAIDRGVIAIDRGVIAFDRFTAGVLDRDSVN
jgi:hypothetical protein